MKLFNNLKIISLMLFLVLILIACGGGSSNPSEELSSNTAPIATPLTVSTDENKNLSISLLGTDENGDTLTYSIISNPRHGTLSGTSPNLIYTAITNYSGNDSFTYKVNDGTLDSSEVMVNIIVNVTPRLVKKTGQKKSYDTSGTEVMDNSVADDGYYEKGVEPNYTRASDIVTDEIRGLMWQDNIETKTVQKRWLTYENYTTCANNKSSLSCYDTSGDTAATYCSELSLGGYSDWRLPTRKELLDLYVYGKTFPAINAIFKNTSDGSYWTSTTLASDASIAWAIYITYGSPEDRAKSNKYYYVKCVRAK